MKSMIFVDQIEYLMGKRVFLRTDLNVPLDKNLGITNDFRIKKALPTIQYLIKNGAKVIIASHLGNPQGKRIMNYSLVPVSLRLSKLLGIKVELAPDCIGKIVQNMVSKMKSGEIIMLENLHFHKSDIDNDIEFSKELALLADIFVNDAFARAHRADASNVGIANYVEIVSGGLLMKDELTQIHNSCNQPKRPIIGILGGDKVNKKIVLLKHIVNKVDALLIGGAMAIPFLCVAGNKVGASIVEEQTLNDVKQITQFANKNLIELHLPCDVKVAKMDSNELHKVVAVNSIQPDQVVMDIGPETIRKFQNVLSSAKTVVWNGPLGKFEINGFAAGTMEIAHFLAKSRAILVIGGGDTVAAIHKAKEEKNIGFLSTGGIALLWKLAGLKMPGIDIINK